MSVNQRNDVGYGLSQPLLDVPKAPIVAERAPTANDRAAIGQIWINEVAGDAYILVSIISNVSTWKAIS